MNVDCDASRLQIHVAARTGGASHGVIVFALTNDSQSTCTVGGYPGLRFRGGVFRKEPSGQLRIRHAGTVRAVLRHGDVWGCPDSGARRLQLAIGKSGYFAVGTVTAYDGPELDLTSLRVTLPGMPHGTTTPVSLFANAPSGQPLPVDVTALRAARWPWMPKTS